MITFYGYAVKKDGKWLGYKVNPKTGLYNRRAFSKNPKFPIVCSCKAGATRECGHLGKIVKVKFTMEDEGSGNGE